MQGFFFTYSTTTIFHTFQSKKSRHNPATFSSKVLHHHYFQFYFYKNVFMAALSWEKMVSNLEKILQHGYFCKTFFQISVSNRDSEKFWLK